MKVWNTKNRLEALNYLANLPPILKYAGGKSVIATKLASILPEHKVYVEPFIGGGSVFFRKPLAKVNVINDKDRDLINFYKSIKNGRCEEIRKCDMPNTRRKFEQMMENKSKCPCSFLGVNKRSYGGKQVNQSFIKVKSGEREAIKFKENCDLYSEKLKRTEILNKDYQEVCKKYDSRETCFYLDPPYDKNSGFYKHEDVEPEEVARLVKSLKGKVMVSYNDCQRVRNAFKGMNFHTINTSYALSGKINKAKELIITNF